MALPYPQIRLLVVGRCPVCGKTWIGDRDNQKTCERINCKVDFARQRNRERKRLDYQKKIKGARKDKHKRKGVGLSMATCLRCDREFKQMYEYNRICPECRDTNASLCQNNTKAALIWGP